MSENKKDRKNNLFIAIIGGGAAIIAAIIGIYPHLKSDLEENKEKTTTKTTAKTSQESKVKPTKIVTKPVVENKKQLIFKVLDAASRKPLSNVSVSLKNETKVANNQGELAFITLTPDLLHQTTFEKQGYKTLTKSYYALEEVIIVLLSKE